MGHILTDEGLKVDDDKVSAIVNMPKPTCKKDVERFLGMITHVGKFLPKMSELTSLLRELLKTDRYFQWNTEQEKAYDLKTLLTKELMLQLQFYDVNKPDDF